MKKCTKCGIEKPLTEFHKDKIKNDGREWAMKPIHETDKYQEKLEEFNAVVDRPITMFVYFDKEMPLDERIVILELDEANKREETGVGGIFLLCFNEPVKVQKVDPDATRK